MSSPINKNAYIIAATVAGVFLVPVLALVLSFFIGLFGLHLHYIIKLILAAGLYVLIVIAKYGEDCAQHNSLAKTKEESMSKAFNKLTKKRAAFVWAGLFVIAVIVCINIGHWLRVEPSSGGTSGEDMTITACTCAQQRVTAMLKAPSTAQFPEVCSKATQQISANNYVVTSYVDAQNSFGAMLRQNYRCHVNVIPNSNECNVSCELLEE